MATQSEIYDTANIAIRDVFGTEVTFEKDGTPYVITAVFTDESEIIIGAGEVTTTEPMLTVRAADMPAGSEPARGDPVTVDTQVYKVWEVERDDSNAYLLMLKKSS